MSAEHTIDCRVCGTPTETITIEGGPLQVAVTVNGLTVAVDHEEALQTALAVLDATGIEFDSDAAAYVAEYDLTDEQLAGYARVYLEALRIRRDRRAAEAAAKAKAEERELMELAEKLFHAKGFPGMPLNGFHADTKNAWLDVARAAKEHFEGKES